MVIAGDTSRISTIQPEWERLPLACELVHLVRRIEVGEIEYEDVSEAPQWQNNRGVVRLLEELDLVKGDNLTETGANLAGVYAEPQQTAIDDDQSVNRKQSLSEEERILLWTVIYHKHQVPMQAAIHQIGTETVPEAQRPEPAERLKERIEYLYTDVNSSRSWIPRAKVHYKWLVQLGLATIQNSQYELTDTGESLFQSLSNELPDAWDECIPDPDTEVDTVLSDFY